MNDTLSDKLALLPDRPGVYLMYDASGTVIYVGKAVSLKNRVRQYFQNSRAHTPKVLAMVSHVETFDTIEVSSENEALSLESNLIKQYLPHYNILLKDDKHFPYVRIDLKQDFPRVELVRRVKRDGATYLGPYQSEGQLKEQLAIVREHFPVRQCRKDIKRMIDRRERPCLLYQIGRCMAPCSGQVSRESYHACLKEVLDFLNGHGGALIGELTERMEKAAEREDFEQAAVLRDRIRAVRALGERQVAISVKPITADVYAAAQRDGRTLVYALYVREGKVVGSHRFHVELEGDADESAVLTAFLPQLYGEADAPRPQKELLLHAPAEDAEALEAWLSERAGRRVRLCVPQRGEKAKLTALALDNAIKALEKELELERRAFDRSGGALAALCGVLGLAEIPTRMECFDNSHLGGEATVSSMVVFTDGKADKNAYRRFRLKGEHGGDDLAAMHEVLERRLERGEPYPDLLIVDGGPTQLAVATALLEERGLTHIPAIGLAEKEELIYLPDRKEPIALGRDDPALQLLQRIRDEAHRFAISYHRTLRGKQQLYSRLDEVKGVGDKRKRALFDRFVTVDALQNASVEELSAVPGMTAATAKAVYASLHSQTPQDGEGEKE